MLLEAGAEVDSVDYGVEDQEDITPLMDAAGNGQIDVMKLLIKYGAKIYKRNKKVILYKPMSFYCLKFA